MIENLGSVPSDWRAGVDTTLEYSLGLVEVFFENVDTTPLFKRLWENRTSVRRKESHSLSVNSHSGRLRGSPPMVGS